MRQESGLTHTKLLIIIAAVAFLFFAATIFVLVDPAKRFAEARNNRRWTDTSLILEAVLEYTIKNRGVFPAGLDEASGTSQVLGVRTSGCDIGCRVKTTVSACLDLSDVLVNQYLGSIPYDPYTGSPEFTGYYINKIDRDRIEVGACDPELGVTIFVSR